MTDNLPAERAPSRQNIAVVDAVPVYDTARFEHMQRVATVMAKASLIPEGLKGGNEQATFGNCFLAVNQAANWDMDPFAVAQCLAVVHGKLCYEGKLIAAVIEKKLGLRLKYEWFGQEGKDDFGIRITNPTKPEETVEGTVGKWKTFEKEKDGGQRKVKGNWLNDPKKQLKYRGDREWARMWAPGIILGVYSDDEIESIEVNMRSNRAIDVTPRTPLSEKLAAPGGEGFSAQHVENETSNEPKTEAQPAEAPLDRQPGSSGDEPQASEKAPVSNGAGPATNPQRDEPAQDQAEQQSLLSADESAPTGKKVGDAAGGQTDAACPPGLLSDYSKALFRVNAVDSLMKIDDQFWKGRAIPKSQHAIAQLQAVMDLHGERCEKKIDKATFDKRLKELLS